MGGKGRGNTKQTNEDQSTSSNNDRVTEGEEEETFTLSQVKQFLKVQEESFTLLIDRMERKIETLREEGIRNKVKFETEMEEIKKSMTFTGDSCIDNKNKMDERLDYMDNDRREFSQYVDRKFAEVEDRNRRNNLRFDNIDEDADNESWEESEKK